MSVVHLWDVRFNTRRHLALSWQALNLKMQWRYRKSLDDHFAVELTRGMIIAPIRGHERGVLPASVMLSSHGTLCIHCQWGGFVSDCWCLYSISVQRNSFLSRVLAKEMADIKWQNDILLRFAVSELFGPCAYIWAWSLLFCFQLFSI